MVLVIVRVVGYLSPQVSHWPPRQLGHRQTVAWLLLTSILLHLCALHCECHGSHYSMDSTRTSVRAHASDPLICVN